MAPGMRMKTELLEDRALPKQPHTQPLPSPALSEGYGGISGISAFLLKKIWREAKELVTTERYVLPVARASCPYARQVCNSK